MPDDILPAAPGFVYFIRAGQSKMVKIGWTRDLRVRLSGLQSGNDKPLRVLLALPGDRRLENQLHLQFHHWRRIGEWFWLDEIIMEFVAANLGNCLWRCDPARARFMATLRSFPTPRNRNAARTGVSTPGIVPNRAPISAASRDEASPSQSPRPPYGGDAGE